MIPDIIGDCFPDEVNGEAVRDTAVCGESSWKCKEFCRFPACLPTSPR